MSSSVLNSTNSDRLHHTMGMEPTLAIPYVRFSDTQQETGSSRERQREMATDDIARMGWTAAPFVEDLGKSAWVVNLPIDRDGDQSGAPFKMDTMLIAEPGTSMSGDDIYNLFERAKREGVTFASLAHTIPNVSVRTIVSEGPGVIDPAPREGGRGTRRKGQ